MNQSFLSQNRRRVYWVLLGVLCFSCTDPASKASDEEELNEGLGVSSFSSVVGFSSKEEVVPVVSSSEKSSESTGRSSFRSSSNPNLNSSSMGEISSSSLPKANLWDYVLKLPKTWAYRGREAFVDESFTTKVSHNQEVYAFQGLGMGVPSVGNEAGVANLVWSGRMSFQAMEAPVWYASFGAKPTFVDRGEGDEYVRFINGLPSNYETEPGQLTPAIAQGEDFHLVYLFRPMPGASYEALMASPSFKDRAGDGSQIQILYQNTNLYGNSGAVSVWGEDNILEVIYQKNGDVSARLNGESVLTGNLPTLIVNGFSEFVLGTNSHVSAHHFRAVILRNGGLFNQGELDSIRELSNEMWPRGRKPIFPYLESQYSNNYLTWDSSEKTFAPKAEGFSGGNGVEGTHLYQWYYWIDPGEGSAWPRNNVLDYHLPFPGTQGQKASLKRSDYEAGNPYGNPVVFLNPGSRQVKVMRVVIPVDSEGTRGEPLAGAWYVDENE